MPVQGETVNGEDATQFYVKYFAFPVLSQGGSLTREELTQLWGKFQNSHSVRKGPPLAANLEARVCALSTLPKDDPFYLPIIRERNGPHGFILRISKKF